MMSFLAFSWEVVGGSTYIKEVVHVVGEGGTTASTFFLVPGRLVGVGGDQNYHDYRHLREFGSCPLGSSLCKILSDLTKNILFQDNLWTSFHGSVCLKISVHLLEN